jgi:hypothetical protein
MADNVAVTAGSGTTIAADEVADGTLGTVKVQYVKIMDATLDGTTKAAVGANGLAVDVKAVAAGTNTIGGVIVKPTATAGGHTLSRVNAAASTNATSLKASAGNLLRISVFNVAAYSVFLKLYNKASAPTVGTDTPTRTIPIPTGTGFAEDYIYGAPFGTGIAYAITKLQADSDTTAVVAGDLTGEISWM